MRLLLPLVLFAACMVDVDGMVPLDPPGIYYQWWARIGECVNRRKDFHDVTYYVVPGADRFPCSHGGGWCAAIHQANRITIAEASLLDASAVTHEMVHAYGFHFHTAIAFRCVRDG